MSNEIERKEKWLKDNAKFSQLFCNRIRGLNPEIGFYIKVEGFYISKDFFKEEYEQINNAYESVMKKLDEYNKK
jgi:hypothetical protein